MLSRKDQKRGQAEQSPKAHSKAANGRPHQRAGAVYLLGDSVFDNEVYVPAGSSVSDCLHAALAGEYDVHCLAVDGATMQDVPAQLKRLPTGATAATGAAGAGAPGGGVGESVFLSVGGNDAVLRAALLDEPVRSVAEGGAALFRLSEEFGAAYGELLDRIGQAGIEPTVCTVYFGDFPDEQWHAAAKAAVRAINFAIVQCAATRKLSVLDVNSVCCEPTDFVSSIEPSAACSEKLADAIAAVVWGNAVSSRFYTGS